MADFPKYLSIQTTSLCNASCVFCPYKDIKDLFPKKIMDMKLFKKIIDECLNYKVERLILYMNNEPLTDPYIIERINYAKEKIPWACVHILTNGVLLTDEMTEKILNSKLDWIGISFHGIRKETVEKTMGINFDITFERINKFIEKAKKIKNIKEYIMITFLKHKYLTDEEKEEAIKYWRNKGIERISFFEAPISRAGNVKSLNKIYHKEKIVGCKSIWAEEMIHITEDGKVILCCMDWRREVILGDLNKESIYSVWNGRRKEIWQMIKGYKEMPEDFLCRRCEEAITEKEKKSVLLVNLPPWGVDTPYLGIASLASYLNKNRIPTQVFDFNIELYNLVPSEYKYLWGMNYSSWWKNKFSFIKDKIGPHIYALMERLLYFPHKIIGFSLPSNWSYTILEEIVRKIKERDKNKIIILGGISISIKEQRFEILKRIEKYIDYCIIGEGEKALYEIVKNIFEKKEDDIKKIKGVLTKDTFFSDGEKAEIESLDELPFPSFEEFDLEKYTAKGSLPIEFSRGCIGNCSFCDFKIISPRFKKKTASYIFNQIKYYIEKYGINHLTVVDPALNSDIKTLEELCDLLIKYKVKIKLSGLAIPRKEMSYELLCKMKKAGFYRLEYGVKSGSDKILKLMRKMFTSEIAEKVIKDTYRAGIEVHLYFIVGFPGEGEKEFNETKEFLKRVALYVTAIKSINPLYVMAGSEIFYHPEKYGIIIPDNEGDRKWYTVNLDNTFDIRRERVLELKRWAKELNIKFSEDAESLEFTLKFAEKKKENEIISIKKKTLPEEVKKCDFLLINLPPWSQENPHIGVGYLCSYLRKKRFKPKVLDLNKKFYLNHQDFKMLWHVENKNFWSNESTFPLILRIFKKDIDEAIKEILSYDCKVLGFSVVDPKEKLTIEFIKRIKEKAPDKKIILGGPATSTYEQRKIFLDNVDKDITAFVIGEGEVALFSLLRNILEKREIDNIEGCMVKKDGKWKYKERKFFIPLDELPFPTYEEFDMSLYGRSILVEWSRGCIGRCAFCKNYKLFPVFRVRSPENILKELRFHKEKYKIEEFTVVDNILNGDLNNLRKVCEKIIKENLKIRWTGQIAPSKNMDFEFFKLLKKAGCFKLQIGFESASNKVLKKMRKTFTQEISEKNIKYAKKAGIETEIFVMIGFPGEDEKEFKKTYDFIKRNSKYIDTIKSINTLHLIAGTDVYEKREDFGIKPLPKENWHYLWETYDGNNYKIRKRRAEILLDLAYNLGIKVMETNITEGKESIFKVIKEKPLCEKIELLRSSINNLQELPQKRIRKIRKKRSFLKYFILFSLSFYIFFYIVYFWMYMILKKKIIWGGKLNKK